MEICSLVFLRQLPSWGLYAAFWHECTNTGEIFAVRKQRYISAPFFKDFASKMICKCMLRLRNRGLEAGTCVPEY